MSETPFELFRMLPSVDEAEAMGQLLEEEGIAYRIDKVTAAWYSARSGVVDANSRMLTIAPELFGGPAGIFQGYDYWQSKNTDPTGEEYFEYDASTRCHGQFVLFAGVFSTLAWSLLIFPVRHC